MSPFSLLSTCTVLVSCNMSRLHIVNCKYAYLFQCARGKSIDQGNTCTKIYWFEIFLAKFDHTFLIQTWTLDVGHWTWLFSSGQGENPQLLFSFSFYSTTESNIYPINSSSTTINLTTIHNPTPYTRQILLFSILRSQLSTLN